MKKAVRKRTHRKSAPAGTITTKGKNAENAAGTKKSLSKQYLKTSPLCKVTFRLPREATEGAREVSIVGDFNNWSITENRMTRLKSGDFKLSINLPCNREYRFRYFIDSQTWENDWFADKYTPNDFGSDDSVVVINGKVN